MAKSKKSKSDTVRTAANPSAALLPNPSAQMTDSDIARRAYELYLAKGREHGHDVEDWLEAERELRGVGRRAVA